MLIGQVKRLIWIQTNIYRVKSIAAFELRTGEYWLLKIYKFLLRKTVAPDQSKQKYTKFLNFGFKSKPRSAVSV